MHRVLLLCLFLLAVLQVRAEDAATPPTNSPQESLRIGPGDLLHVSVLREPDLEQKVRVRDSGEITLPMAGDVKVAGLSTPEADAAIAQRYIDQQYLKHPIVSVFVEEYETQPVAVLGQVIKPGTYPITTARSLLDILAMAGGLTESADRHITIERGGGNGLVEVFLSNHADDAFNANLKIMPGDRIIVPKAGIVYVLGDVGRPGGYVMQNESRMTVLQAIAMAAGANKTAAESRARILHNNNGQYEERDLPLKEIERGDAPDELLKADDVIFIPFSYAKNIVVGTSAIVTSASSALIYAGH